MRRPIAHDLRSDTMLQRQAAAGADFLFRKEMLPCEHVKWRKRKMSTIGYHVIVVIIRVYRIDGRRRLDALVFPQQARMRLLEIGERVCQPGMVLKALPVPEPVVGALRQPSNESACARVEGRDA